LRLILAFLSFLLPAAAAVAEDRTGGGGDVQVARTAVIGRELGTELLRYSAGSPVFLGNEGTLPVVIIADPKRDSGDQPNPDLFHRTLPGCQPGSLVSCCFRSAGIPPSVWYFTLYGWINSSKACQENLERTTAPTDIEPPRADTILLYSGINNELITTAGQGDDLRVLHVHDKHRQAKLICGRVTNPCASSPQAGQGTKCGLDAPKSGTLWAAHVCEVTTSWARLPDPCACSK